MTGEQVPERIRWAVRTMAPGPDDHLLEIGCGPGVAVAHVCQRLAGGQILAIDRSATAIARAARRAAAGAGLLYTTTSPRDRTRSRMPSSG
jgi:ubiquinone/menaquinone biosynthesis C-methylase UbiE